MQQDISIDLGDLFRFIKRGLLIALLVSGAAAALAYYHASSQPAVYETRATVIASQGGADLRAIGVSPVMAPPLDVSAYRAALFSDPVLAQAANLTGIAEPTASDLRGMRSGVSVRSEVDRNSSLIHIDVQDGSPTRASDRANALANALVQWDRQRAGRTLTQGMEILDSRIAAVTDEIRALQVAGGAQDEIDGLIRERAELQNNLNVMRTLSTAVMSYLDVMQPAPVGRSVSANVILNSALAFMLGLVVTYGVLLLRSALDTRLRNVEDLANVTGMPILAEFPKLPKNIRRMPPEASSYLRTNLLFATSDVDPKVIMVTSANTGEGKSSVALSLAESFARNDYNTLLVDADLRMPVMAQEYHLDERRYASFLQHLEHPHERFEPARVAINLTQHLDVVPTFQGPGSPAELLSRHFRDWLDIWRREYDVIVLDSAPLLAVADALTIAPLCTGSVLVASQEASDRRSVKNAVELLQRLGVRVLGVAATHVTEKTSQRGVHAYGYGYGYGYGKDSGDAPTPVISAKSSKAMRTQPGRVQRPS